MPTFSMYFLYFFWGETSLFSNIYQLSLCNPNSNFYKLAATIFRRNFHFPSVSRSLSKFDSSQNLLIDLDLDHAMVLQHRVRSLKKISSHYFKLTMKFY